MGGVMTHRLRTAALKKLDLNGFTKAPRMCLSESSTVAVGKLLQNSLPQSTLQ